jgi:hypothetical protein
MSISDATENALMLLVFNATTWANYALNATTSPETQIVWALHTADPGDAGSMSTNEMTTGAYNTYARVTTLRASGAGGMTVTAGSVSPQANVSFAAGVSGTGATATFFSTGKSGGGASAILWSGTITPNIACGAGVTPILTTATALTLDNFVAFLISAGLLLASAMMC